MIATALTVPIAFLIAAGAEMVGGIAFWLVPGTRWSTP